MAEQYPERWDEPGSRSDGRGTGDGDSGQGEDRSW
jgi:hypothetical protein